MSEDKIKLNYPAMQEMAKHCHSTSQRLTETLHLAQQAALEMQNGAMVGDPGEAFSSSLNTAFIPSVTKLRDKFEEVAHDIQTAIADMQAEDKQAASKFK